MDIIHFATYSMEHDISRVYEEHKGNRQRSSLLCENLYNNSKEFKHIYIIGHSGARPGIHNTLKNAPQEMRDRTDVITFGGAGAIPKDLASRVVNYCSEHDYLSKIITHKFSEYDIQSGRASVITLKNLQTSKILLNHGMEEDTYKSQLKGLVA